MNPFDLRWLWKALRGRSVTFAMVFFLAMVGASAYRVIRSVLELLSLPWLVAWIAPLILVGLLAKLEPKLIPSENLRARIGLGIIVAALVLVFVMPSLIAQKEDSPPDETEEEQPLHPRRIRPPGRN